MSAQVHHQRTKVAAKWCLVGYVERPSRIKSHRLNFQFTCINANYAFQCDQLTHLEVSDSLLVIFIILITPKPQFYCVTPCVCLGSKMMHMFFYINKYIPLKVWKQWNEMAIGWIWCGDFYFFLVTYKLQ